MKKLVRKAEKKTLFLLIVTVWYNEVFNTVGLIPHQINSTVTTKQHTSYCQPLLIHPFNHPLNCADTEGLITLFHVKTKHLKTASAVSQSVAPDDS